jgi:hypothetical protein
VLDPRVTRSVHIDTGDTHLLASVCERLTVLPPPNDTSQSALRSLYISLRGRAVTNRVVERALIRFLHDTRAPARLRHLTLENVHMLGSNKPLPGVRHVLVSALAGCSELQSLTLRACSLHAVGAQLLGVALTESGAPIQSLTLERNGFGDVGAAALASFFTQRCAHVLECVTIDDNDLRFEGIIDVLDALSSAPCGGVRHLTLRGLHLLEAQLVTTLERVLLHSSTLSAHLESLHVPHWQAPPERLSALADALAIPTRLRSLDVRGLVFTDADFARLLLPALAPRLEHFAVSGLTQRTLGTLVSALGGVRAHLSSLHLEKCEGRLVELEPLLCGGLQRLHLELCDGLDPRGLPSAAHEPRRRLEHVAVRWSSIGVQAISALLRALAPPQLVARTLRTLDLSCNFAMADDGGAVLEAYLEDLNASADAIGIKQCALESLALDSCDLTDEFLARLSGVLLRSSRVALSCGVSLFENSFSSAAESAWARALHSAPHLNHLALVNELGEEHEEEDEDDEEEIETASAEEVE